MDALPTWRPSCNRLSWEEDEGRMASHRQSKAPRILVVEDEEAVLGTLTDEQKRELVA